ncbi:MAG: ParB/RepB/Spo0J family partition protein [Bacterioplanes sp.]|nr:ParB/RepB/Spo0J family partition protein [Bacterioplanes sp.]
MSNKKRGLGRGLDALLTNARPRQQDHDGDVAALAVDVNHSELQSLSVAVIQPGQYQPRRDIQPESLDELAASIKAQGLMQPIIVRPLSGFDDRYEIIAGERRWRACRLLEMTHIPALVREVDDESAIALALIENIQREDLNPMEEAIALHRLQHEFELTQQQVADAVGKNRATIANLLRLMKLNDDVKRLLEHGDIEMGHARALLALEGGEQSDAAAQVVSRALTVRQTEALVRQWQEPVLASPEKAQINPDIQRLERMLGDRLGAKVAIQHGQKGKGKLVISYTSLDELDGILNHIQ